MAIITFDPTSFTYERDSQSSYLVLKLKPEDVITKYQVEMISNNELSLVLPLHLRVRNNETYCYYNITSKQGLSQVLQRKGISIRNFINILKGILKAITISNEYLLSYKSFLLKEDYIYINPADLQISLIYLPLTNYQENFNDDLRNLVHKLIAAVDTKEDLRDSFIHKIIATVNNENFNIQSLSKLLMEIEAVEKPKEMKNLCTQKVSETSIKPEPALKPLIKNREVNGIKKSKSKKYKLILVLSQLLIVIIVLLISVQTELFNKEKFEITTLLGVIIIFSVFEYLIFTKVIKPYKISNTEVRHNAVKKEVNKKDNKKDIKNIVKGDSFNLHKKEIQNAPSNNQYLINHRVDDATGIICDSINNDTVIIDMETSMEPYLTTIKDGTIQKIIISKPQFIIGKIKDQVDLYILDKVISRIHAEIVLREEGYYIRDLNSKNGTFLNGKAIDSNKLYPLDDGYTIGFANREFTFVLKN